jgi:hypothetical protein
MVSSKEFSGGGVTASSPERLTNESEGVIIMASNGFDPNQARDKDGKWTDEGAFRTSRVGAPFGV